MKAYNENSKTKDKAKEPKSSDPLPLFPDADKKKIKTLKQYAEESGNQQPGWMNQKSSFIEIRERVVDAVQANDRKKALEIVHEETLRKQLSFTVFSSLLSHIYGRDVSGTSRRSNDNMG